MNLIFCVLTYTIIYVLIHQIIFRFYLLKYSFIFFKYSCTNIFHRHSLYTFYTECDIVLMKYGKYTKTPAGYSEPLLFTGIHKIPRIVTVTTIVRLPYLWAACRRLQQKYNNTPWWHFPICWQKSLTLICEYKSSNAVKCYLRVTLNNDCANHSQFGQQPLAMPSFIISD